MADLSKLANELSNLTVLEAAKLATMLQEKWDADGKFHSAPARGRQRLRPPSPDQRDR